LITPLLSCKPLLRIVVLTGYASIATAVDAIKLGACHYLTKPAEVDDIIAAFGETMAMPDGDAPSKPTSLERAEWEYIQATLQACEGNVSAAAKRLGLHRRTLQRKLQKRPSGLD
jgi:two-component system response regulator RegA